MISAAVCYRHHALCKGLKFQATTYIHFFRPSSCTSAPTRRYAISTGRCALQFIFRPSEARSDATKPSELCRSATALNPRHRGSFQPGMSLIPQCACAESPLSKPIQTRRLVSLADTAGFPHWTLLPAGD